MLETGVAGELSDNGKNYAGYIVKGVQRMQALIDDLLTYAQVGTTSQQDHVELGDVVDEVRTLLAADVTASGAQVDVDDMPAVVGDTGQLRALFLNLLANAIKFRKPDTAPRIRVSAARKSDRLHIEVSDNGIGIDPKFHDRVFKMFQRLHASRDYPGTGIGLAICRRVVDNHEGRITLDGSPGVGTVVRFDLPAAT